MNTNLKLAVYDFNSFFINEKDNKILSNMFTCYDERNILEFQKLLNVFLPYLTPNEDQKKTFQLIKDLSLMSYDINNQTVEINENNYKPLDKSSNNLRMYIINRLYAFASSNYFYFVNSDFRLRNTAVSKITISNLDKMKSIGQNNNLDGLITKDGTYYMAISEHEYLCNYLNALSINLSNALRICQARTSPHKLHISSFYNYPYINYTEEENHLILSDETVNTFCSLLETIVGKNYLFIGDTPRDIIIKNSSNLGFDINSWDTISTRYNLMSFEERLGRDNFSFSTEFKTVKSNHELYATKPPIEVSEN